MALVPDDEPTEHVVLPTRPKHPSPIRAVARGPKRAGRPGHVVTDVQKRLVQHWVAAGLSQNKIAGMMGISPDTLQKYYRFELDHGEEIANANVAANLYRIATSDAPSAAGAAQYWLNRRSEKFKEVKRVELTGKDGKPMQVDSRVASIDVRKLDADERDTLRALLMKASDDTIDAVDAEYEEAEDLDDEPDDAGEPHIDDLAEGDSNDDGF